MTFIHNIQDFRIELEFSCRGRRLAVLSLSNLVSVEILNTALVNSDKYGIYCGDHFSCKFKT